MQIQMQSSKNKNDKENITLQNLRKGFRDSEVSMQRAIKQYKRHRSQKKQKLVSVWFVK